MGGAVSSGETNDELIDNLVEARYIKDTLVERVFRAVDRGHYYTEPHKDTAYKDLAWKDGNLHLSAPCIYAKVLEGLNLRPGLSFLNLGSGTGYLSTMAGLIIGPGGVNHGIEFFTDVVDYAKERLLDFLTTNSIVDELELCQPRFVVGNCLSLCKPIRTYDRVYCGAACPQNYLGYMKNLLNVSGILIMPLNDQLVKITRLSETGWTVKELIPVSFATLIGPMEPASICKLPTFKPLRLDAMSRLKLRHCLREVIKIENPIIKERTSQRKLKSKRQRLSPCQRKATLKSEADWPSQSSYTHSSQSSDDRDFGTDKQVDYESSEEDADISSSDSILFGHEEAPNQSISDLNFSTTENVTTSSETPSYSGNSETGRSASPVFLFSSSNNNNNGHSRPRVWKRIADDSDTESEEETPHKKVAPTPKFDCLSMTELMNGKINQLPLPSKLKNFLKFNGAPLL